MADRGELGTEVEVEDTELVEPSRVAALDEDAEEIESALGSCCPLFAVESSSCVMNVIKFFKEWFVLFVYEIHISKVCIHFLTPIVGGV